MMWLPRKTTISNGDKSKVTVELVYGYVDGNEVRGETFHTLSGPTAFSSIKALAESYNKKGKTPPEKPKAKTRCDGWRQTKRTPLGGGLTRILNYLKAIAEYAARNLQAI